MLRRKLIYTCAILGVMIVQVAVLKHPLDSIFPAMYLAGVVMAFLKLRPI